MRLCLPCPIETGGRSHATGRVHPGVQCGLRPQAQQTSTNVFGQVNMVSLLWCECDGYTCGGVVSLRVCWIDHWKTLRVLSEQSVVEWIISCVLYIVNRISRSCTKTSSSLLPRSSCSSFTRKERDLHTHTHKIEQMVSHKNMHCDRTKSRALHRKTAYHSFTLTDTWRKGYNKSLSKTIEFAGLRCFNQRVHDVIMLC